MKFNNKTILVIFLITASSILLKIIPLFEKDADKIQKIIYSAKTATQKEEILKCISYISLAYQDKDGNNRASLFLIAQNVFKEYNDIFIIVEDLKIEVIDEKNAIAHILTSGQAKRQSGNILDTARVRFDAVFKKEQGAWKVIELKFIEPEDFLRLLKVL